MISEHLWHILRHLGYEETLYIGVSPGEGDYVTITDTGGMPNPRWLHDEFNVQFRSSSTSPENYIKGYKMLDEIKNLLLGVKTIRVEEVEMVVGNGIKIGEDRWYNFVPTESGVIDVKREIDYLRYIVTSDIRFLGWDLNNRPAHSLNFEIVRQERQNIHNREAIV